MANLRTDSPLSRRIARSFLHFLNSVEPSAGVDGEALGVAKDCLAEVFKIDQSSLDSHSNVDSLIDIFSSRVAVDNGDAPTTSTGKNAQVFGEPRSQVQDRTREQHSPGRDELFGQFFGALEKIHYFRRMPDGNDDQIQLDRATNLFHNAVEEMQKAGVQTFDQKSLAETFKSQGNKAMQSKLYAEAIELYTFAVALCDNNAVYYCNRAAAYTQIHRYADAVQDCQKSIEINPSYSKAYSRLGFAYYAQGKYREAIDKGFKKALELDPNNDAVKENIRVAEQKLRQEQQRARTGQSSTSTSSSHRQSNHQCGGGSGSNSTAAAPPPPFTSIPFNINGLPIDITSMLRNMTGNAHPGQNFGNAPQGESNTGVHNEQETGSIPFNIDGLPIDIASMLRNMTGTAHPGQNFGTAPQGESEAGGAHDEPEIRIGGNINANVNELPEELSGAFRSMMGMFSGAAPPNGNQQDNNNGRPGPS